MDFRDSVLIQTGPSAWLRFSNPCETVRAGTGADVHALLGAVEAAVGRGLIAAGFLTYEAAPGMDRAFCTHPPAALPAAWFGFYRAAEQLAAPPPCDAHFDVGPWVPAVAEFEYRAAAERIRDYIRAGDTYQVNYTIRLRSSFSGDPYAYFLSLCRAQRAGNCAFLAIDDVALCSVSPELFFRLDGDLIEARPMKGTVARGTTPEDDRARAEWLGNSEKNRAENIMIVDMVRNDIGRIAEPGSVHVPEMFTVERYPTVWQMTSTVRAETHASLPAIVRALFPCASITGAPKVRTMQIIRELETTPRGIYTGSIGFIGQRPAPGLPGTGRIAHFNVAIRTVAVNTVTASAEYGVGGGIVWDSDPAAEYAECLIKAAVLRCDNPEFRLLETILWDGRDGFFLLDRHMARLSGSAEYFGFKFSIERVTTGLEHAVDSLSEAGAVVRLLVDRDGGVEIEVRPPPAARDVFMLALAPTPVDRADVFLYHKTTNRTVYERARESCPGCDDVILHNAAGWITETSIANIVVRLDGRLITPAVESGLLPGTFRAHLLETGEISEGVVTVQDLKRAEELHLINSVRKWMAGRIIGGMAN